MIRYAIYARCSSDDQAAGDYSTIDAQRELLTRYAAERGGEVVAVYTDEGVSGTAIKRPSMTRLIAAAKRKEFDTVAATFMSRIGRGDAFTILRHELRTAGVSVELARESFANDVGGYVQRAATQMMDGMYPVMVSGWVKTKQQAMVAQGHFCGTRLPFGLTTEGEEGAPRRVVAVADLLPLVEKAYRLFVATRSLSAVQEYFKDAAPGSREWHLRTVEKLLRNELYRGVLRFGVNVNREAFPPILPKELTDAVDAAFEGRCLELPERPAQRREVKRDPFTYYLRGAVYCAACGCRMTPKHATGTAGIVPYYQCMNMVHNIAPCIGAKRINAHRLHYGVLTEIAACAAAPSRIERLCQQAVRYLPGPEAEIARARAIRSEIKRIDTGLKRITSAITQGAGGLASLVTEGKRMEMERARLSIEAASAEQMARAASGRRPDAQAVARDFGRLLEGWERGEEAERALFMSLLVERADLVEQQSAVIHLRMTGFTRGTFDFVCPKTPLSSSKSNHVPPLVSVYPPSVAITILLPSARKAGVR